MTALHAELAHKDAEIERLQKRVERLQELAYAPDGKEYRSMLFAEAAKRLPLQEEIERLQSLVESLSDDNERLIYKAMGEMPPEKLWGSPDDGQRQGLPPL